MPIRPYRSATWLCVLLALLGLTQPGRGQIETRKFTVLISANETKGTTSDAWTYGWALDGQWRHPSNHIAMEVTLDSDFSKSESSTVDRLRTALRLISPQYGKEPSSHWYPVMLIQTEGDHEFDSVHTLLAAGYRQQQPHGFLEFTLGASKDLRTAEQWVGDVGIAFAYEHKLGERWKLTTGPKADYGAFGELRARGDRLRYSWDVNVTYQMTDSLGLGYRLWYGNTVPDSRRTQWLGISYKVK